MTQRVKKYRKLNKSRIQLSPQIFINVISGSNINDN